MDTLMNLGGVLITLAAYALSSIMHARLGSPFTTPVFFSTALIVLVLLVTGTPFSAYAPSRDLMVELLGPATVALAVPIFKSRRVLVAHAVPALAGICAGVAATVLVALAGGVALGLSQDVLLSMSVKSLTAPVAVELAGHRARQRHVGRCFRDRHGHVGCHARALADGPYRNPPTAGARTCPGHHLPRAGHGAGAERRRAAGRHRRHRHGLGRDRHQRGPALGAATSLRLNV